MARAPAHRVRRRPDGVLLPLPARVRNLLGVVRVRGGVADDRVGATRLVRAGRHPADSDAGQAGAGVLPRRRGAVDIRERRVRRERGDGRRVVDAGGAPARVLARGSVHGHVPLHRVLRREEGGGALRNRKRHRGRRHFTHAPVRRASPNGRGRAEAKVTAVPESTRVIAVLQYRRRITISSSFSFLVFSHLRLRHRLDADLGPGRNDRPDVRASPCVGLRPDLTCSGVS
mmetsp:Transcript_14958/g.64733  ORF Transcript_14958/g.64733 Transcript_14958/m.64733 type:complete len:230 (+) Transcript_14958:413-1102(+)